MKVRNLERRQQLEAWEVSMPSGQGEGQELELPSECGLQPPYKKSGSGSESEEAAEEAESGLSSGELPQPPRRRSMLEEEWFESEETEEAEEAEEDEHRAPRRRRAGSRRKGWNACVEASEERELQSQRSNPSSSDPQGPQRRKARATELEGMWDLEKMKKQLEQNLERGECGAQHPGSRGSCSGGERGGSRRPGPRVQAGLACAPGARGDCPLGQER